MAYTFKYGDRPIEGVTVQRAVGRGGFGEVYYALTDSGKQVAIKYLRDNPEIELRGISHVMNLKSPHLITIYDVKQNAHGEPFVIMEYVSGPSLHDLLVAEPDGLGPQKAAFFLDGIAKGLSYLHDRGIVHRDMKPGNIFYDDGYVKIGDYGLSKHIAVSRHSGQTVSVGTVHYMAPEIGSGSYTKAIDVYALGVMLYEMLTGKLPFTGSSMGEILMRHLSEAPDLGGISEPFATVISRALQKDPADRYQDVNAMVDAIRASESVSESISTFDPAALSSVPRTDPDHQPDATVTAGGRLPPVPVLDARDAARAGGFGARFDDKVERFARRLEKGAERVARRLDREGGAGDWHGRGSDEAPEGDRRAQREQRRQRRIQFVVLAAVTLSASMGLGFLAASREMPESGIAVALLLGGSIVGAIVTHFAVLRRAAFGNTILNRLVYPSIAAAFMLPGLALAIEEVHGDFAGLFVAPLAVLLLCDWNARIDAGRRGKVEFSSAVFPGIVGLVTSAIATDGDYPLLGGAVGMLMSLLTQATAGIWPLRLPRAMPVAAGAIAAGEPQMQAGHPAWQAAAPRPIGPIGRIEPIEPVLAHRAPAGAAQSGQANSRLADSEPAGTSAAVAKMPPAPPQSAPAYLEGPQPSFVGRTANAGLALLGKMLLLAGITAALFYHCQIPSADMRSGEGRDGYWSNGEVWAPTYRGEVEKVFYLPPGFTLVPVILGSLFLVTSRRNDGGFHFFRAFLGCLVGVLACIVALGPAGDALAVFLTGAEWSDLRNPEHTMAITGTALLLGLSAGLLFWPKRRRSVHNKL